MEGKSQANLFAKILPGVSVPSSWYRPVCLNESDWILQKRLVRVSLLALSTRGEGRVKIKCLIFWLTFVGGNYNFYNRL